MPLHQFYSGRIQDLQKKLSVVQQKETRLSFLRLGSFVVTLAIFYFTFGYNIELAVILLFTGLALFGYILKLHLKTTHEKQHIGYLIEINKKELACLNGDFLSYPDGKEHIQKEHPYSGDLDIFGKASLFQYLNRTTSNPGSTRLAEWLKQPADIKEIRRRQEAITEMKELAEWRQQLIAIGYRYAGSANDPTPILEWVNGKNLFLNRRGVIVMINILSVLAVGLIIGCFFGLPSALISLVLTINFFVLSGKIPNINKIHRNVSKTVEMLKAYKAIISLIEQQPFRSEKLCTLKKHFEDNGPVASKKIEQLARRVNKLDFRLNIMVSIPLNLFYFWDIRQVIKLEKWKVQNQETLPHWFDTMAEFEALISLANLYHNNPEWVMPDITPEHFKLNAVEIGHPLIIKENRVCNSLEIKNRGKIILVTGSNMSGKSTFLRTCGINIVLAMTGAPVCAKSFEVSRVCVFTSMRIIDSLEENTSSFYAELKRLASIIRTVEQNEKVFLLLDEILRGTNSNDRHVGSVALIKQFVKNEAATIIATHDLALSSLENEIPDKIENYNFDVKIENDELFFDYKLNKGICKSLNASILMKKMGINL
jgi:DNA mismatch repair ATPase MutS